MIERFTAFPFRRPARRLPWWSASRRFLSGYWLDALRGGALRGVPLPVTGSTPSVVEHFATVLFLGPARRPAWWSASQRFSSRDPLVAQRGEALLGSHVLGPARRSPWWSSLWRSLSGHRLKASVVDRFAAVRFRGPVRRPSWWSASRRSTSGDMLDALRGGALRGGSLPVTSSSPSMVEQFATVFVRVPARRPAWWSASRQFSFRDRLVALRGEALRGSPVP